MSASRGGFQPWWRSCRTRSAKPASSVATAPPSPVVTIFRGWKERQPTGPPAARPSLPSRAERAGGVLDQRQRRQLLEPGRAAEQVHRRAIAFVPPGSSTLAGSRFIVTGSTSTSSGSSADERDHVGRGREGERGDEHLVARLDAERQHGEVERRRSRRDGDRVLDARRPRASSVLELDDLRPLRQAARTRSTSADRGGLLGARRPAGRAGSGRRRLAFPVPGDRPQQALVEVDLRLEAEQLPRLAHGRDAQLDVGVVQRAEDDLARAAGEGA